MKSIFTILMMLTVTHTTMASTSVVQYFVSNTHLCESYNLTLQTYDALEAIIREYQLNRAPQTEIDQWVALKADQSKMLLRLGQSEAVTAVIHVSNESVLQFRELAIKAGESVLPLAHISGIIDNQIQFLNPGVNSLRVVLTMAGACPFWSENISSAAQTQSAIEKAWKALLKP